MDRPVPSSIDLSGRGCRVALGFTLIEMLVVISIISLLISMLMPALGRAKSAAIDMQCANQLRQAAVALGAYVLDENDSIFWRGNQTWRDDPRVTGMDWYVYAGKETGNTYVGGQGNFFNALVPRPLNSYLGDQFRNMQCPYDSKNWNWAGFERHYEWVGNSYIFNTYGDPFLSPALGVGLAGGKSAQVKRPSLTVLFLDASIRRAPFAWHHDQKGNFAFVDTHVEYMAYLPPNNERGVGWDP